MRLPGPERREPGLRGVALRLAVPDEIDVGDDLGALFAPLRHDLLGPGDLGPRGRDAQGLALPGEVTGDLGDGCAAIEPRLRGLPGPEAAQVERGRWGAFGRRPVSQRRGGRRGTG